MIKSKSRNSEIDFTNSDLTQKLIDDLLHTHKFDLNVFYSIKKTQQIPDEVIINFLKAESSLCKSKFKTRILSDNK